MTQTGKPSTPRIWLLGLYFRLIIPVEWHELYYFSYLHHDLLRSNAQNGHVDWTRPTKPYCDSHCSVNHSLHWELEKLWKIIKIPLWIKGGREIWNSLTLGLIFDSIQSHEALKKSLKKKSLALQEKRVHAPTDGCGKEVMRLSSWLVILSGGFFKRNLARVCFHNSVVQNIYCEEKRWICTKIERWWLLHPYIRERTSNVFTLEEIGPIANFRRIPRWLKLKWAFLPLSF